jgi:hypothetical protein
MKNYESPMVVELGNADALVLGLGDQELDNPVDPRFGQQE